MLKTLPKQGLLKGFNLGGPPIDNSNTRGVVRVGS